MHWIPLASFSMRMPMGCDDDQKIRPSMPVTTNKPMMKMIARIQSMIFMFSLALDLFLKCFTGDANLKIANR